MASRRASRVVNPRALHHTLLQAAQRTGIRGVRPYAARAGARKALGEGRGRQTVAPVGGRRLAAEAPSAVHPWVPYAPLMPCRVGLVRFSTSTAHADTVAPLAPAVVQDMDDGAPLESEGTPGNAEGGEAGADADRDGEGGCQMSDHHRRLSQVMRRSPGRVAGLFAKLERDDPTFVADTKAYNILLAAYKRLKHLDGVERVLSEMRGHPEFPPDVYSYGTAMGAAFNVGAFEKGMDYYQEMKGAGITPNAVVFQILVGAYLKRNDYVAAEALLVQLARHVGHVSPVAEGGAEAEAEVEVDADGTAMAETDESGTDPHDLQVLRQVHSFVANGYASARRFDNNATEVERFVQRMDTEQGIAPDEVLYTGAIKAVLQKGDLSGAYFLLDRMESRGITGNAYTFNTLLHAHLQRRDVEGVASLLQRMQAAEVAPNHVTYTTVMRALCKRGQLEAAGRVFHSLTKAGVAPDVVVYNVLLEGCLAEAEREQDTGLASVPSADDDPLWESIAESLGADEDPACSLDPEGILLQMDRQGIAPNVVTYATLMSYHARSGNLEGMYLLYDAMEEAQVKPNVVVFNIMLKAALVAGDTESVADIQQMMKQAKVYPDVVTYTTLVTHSDVDEDQRRTFLDFLKSRQLRPDGRAYSVAVHALLDVGDVDAADELEQSMRDLVTPTRGKPKRIRLTRSAWQRLEEARAAAPDTEQ